MKSFVWKKGLFKCDYKLFGGGKHIGGLVENPWSQSAKGKIGERNMSFKIRNAFNPRADIIDLDAKEVVGSIKFSCWWSKARVNYKGKSLQWKYRNWWSTKWSLVDADGKHVGYNKGWSTNGTIVSELEDDVLLLTGLYIAHYYWQMIAVYITCIFMPMWIIFI